MAVIFQLLRSLSAAEHRLLAKSLGTEDRTAKTYCYLIDRSPDFDIDGDDLLRHCAPGMRVESQSVNRLYDKLRAHVEAFLVERAVASDPSLRLLLLQRELGKRGINARFERVGKTLRATTAQPNQQSEVQHFRAYQAQLEYIEYGDPGRIDDYVSFFRGMVDRLDEGYLTARFKAEIEQFNRGRIYKDVAATALPETAAALLDQLGEGISFPVRFLANLQRWQRRPQDADLHAYVRSWYQRYFDEVTADEARFVLTVLVNQYHQLINATPDPALMSDLFDFYRRGVDDGLLRYGQEIRPVTFISIANVATFVRAFDWLDRFVSVNGPRLPKEMQADCLRLAGAGKLFAQAADADAYQLLRRAPFAFRPFRTAARFLEVRLLYRVALKDRTSADSFFAEVRAMRAWLRDDERRQSAAASRDRIANGLTLLLRLYRHQTDPNSADNRASLLTQLQTYPAVIAGPWFRREIDSL